MIERKGNFFAHHTYQCYRPSKEELEKSGLPPMDFDYNIEF
jgi:hypothetical protein